MCFFSLSFSSIGLWTVGNKLDDDDDDDDIYYQYYLLTVFIKF